MNYSKNETRKIKLFAAWSILWLIGLSIGIVIISGFIHLFSCSNVLKVNAEPANISEEIIVEEPEETLQSLGQFKFTAYCACEKCCGKSDGITKTGTKATEGRTIAVDPNMIPLGSEVIIDGQKYIAEDVGGAIKGNRIDVYFESHQKALEFGVQHKEVFINAYS